MVFVISNFLHLNTNFWTENKLPDASEDIQCTFVMKFEECEVLIVLYEERDTCEMCCVSLPFDTSKSCEAADNWVFKE